MKIVNAREIAEKHKAEKIVLIASRRTDMPRFYLQELYEGLLSETFHPQGLMQKIWKLQFKAKEIHSIGLWSQDYSLFLKKHKKFTDLGYNFWFRFTILPDDPVIKPVAPPLKEQLYQLESLCTFFNKDGINVCVDPIFLYTKNNMLYNAYTSEFLEKLCLSLCQMGIGFMTISIIDLYKKVLHRLKRYEVQLIPKTLSNDEYFQKVYDIIYNFKKIADTYAISVRSCCENDLTDLLLTERGTCTDGHLLNTLFGPGASTKSDLGQRKKSGCTCTLSVDIGRYTSTGEWNHQCFHHCPHCYARR